MEVGVVIERRRRSLRPFRAWSTTSLVLAGVVAATSASAAMAAPAPSRLDGSRTVMAPIVTPVTGVATLVVTRDLSILAVPSSDPAGVTWLEPSSQLVVSDSEVNELAIFSGANLFQLTLQGDLVRTGLTADSPHEPSGLSHDPATGILYHSNDDTDRIYLIQPGPDGAHGGADDSVTAFDTRAFGSNDAEGVAHDPTTGHLFIADGSNRAVHEVAPGINGFFDGVPPGGDDTVSSFDLSRHGALDPEGITHRDATNTLLVVDPGTDKVIEVTKDGDHLRTIDVKVVDESVVPFRPAGITLAPASSGVGGTSIYIADRGADNEANPDEIDGRLHELAYDFPDLSRDPPPPADTAAACPEGVIPPAGFTDVAPGSLHADDIDCIAFYGITTGITPTAFDPTRLVSRWEMALFLTRTLQASGITLPDGSPVGFTDIGGLAGEAQLAINQLAQLGVARGTSPTTFDPFGAVTRWQMALFLTRTLRSASLILPDGFPQGFTDIAHLTPDQQRAVHQLAQLDITRGTSATTYGPRNPVTREQMSSFLIRTSAILGLAPS